MPRAFAAHWSLRDPGQQSVQAQNQLRAKLPGSLEPTRICLSQSATDGCSQFLQEFVGVIWRKDVFRREELRRTTGILGAQNGNPAENRFVSHESPDIFQRREHHEVRASRTCLSRPLPTSSSENS